ncbi:hypothetical protein KKF86_00815 [bacterium]|nr:hypothetical protein [bacterium]
MLNEVKSRFLSGKKLFKITILTIGLIAYTNAQGITNTLGGNTEEDKFIVENNDAEAGLVVTGNCNVGIGTTEPGLHYGTKFDVVGGISFRTKSSDPTKVIMIIENRIFTDAFSGTPTDLILGTFPNGHSNQLVLHQSTGNVGIGTTTPTEKLDLNGNMNLNGEVNRNSATGTANLVPIAYGTISLNGDINSGTGNFTCTWNSNHYEIVIDGEDYYWADYTTLVSIIGGYKIAYSNSGIPGENKLLIWIINASSDSPEQWTFQFVTYKS